ncbi:MAG: NUDIX hydrolase [Ignavibacteria bacterium]|nr:NUDIX hydrolase [Ignavibacteria bacterium]
MEKWKTVSISKEIDLKIFKAQWIKRENPQSLLQSEFIVLNSPNWVNVIPITSDDKVVMIKQYRHGTDEITLEVPGGLVDDGEDPADASVRECVEETGYFSSERPIYLGVNRPNPAFLNNYCFSFLWRDVEKRFNPKFDSNEEIEVVLFDLDEVYNKIERGEINHSMVLNAFFFLKLFLK